MIQKSYKYRLYPTKAQKELIEKHFGCNRWIYNWGLTQKIKSYELTKKTENFMSLGKKLPPLKAEFPWLAEVQAQSLQLSLKNLDNGFKRFFKQKKGFPKFKSKRKSRASYGCPQGVKVDFSANIITIPKLKEVKAILSRSFKGKIKTGTVSKTKTGKYFISILVETEGELPKPKKVKPDTTIGLDVGIKTYITFSDGCKIENPKYLDVSLKKIKREHRKLSRKTKGGKNFEKQRLKLARAYEKVTNQRDDFLHKVTYNLTHDNQVDTIVVEDLSISNLLKNHKLAKAISDASWSKFFTFLKYKCEWYGKNLITIGRFDPSSKLCSKCGNINKELTLADREWTCACGAVHDRDILAANNIKHFGLLKQNTIKPLG